MDEKPITRFLPAEFVETFRGENIDEFVVDSDVEISRVKSAFTDVIGSGQRGIIKTNPAEFILDDVKYAPGTLVLKTTTSEKRCGDFRREFSTQYAVHSALQEIADKVEFVRVLKPLRLYLKIGSRKKSSRGRKISIVADRDCAILMERITPLNPEDALLTQLYMGKESYDVTIGDVTGKTPTRRTAPDLKGRYIGWEEFENMFFLDRSARKRARDLGYFISYMCHVKGFNMEDVEYVISRNVTEDDDDIVIYAIDFDMVGEIDTKPNDTILAALNEEWYFPRPGTREYKEFADGYREAVKDRSVIGDPELVLSNYDNSAIRESITSFIEGSEKIDMFQAAVVKERTKDFTLLLPLLRFLELTKMKSIVFPIAFETILEGEVTYLDDRMFIDMSCTCGGPANVMCADFPIIGFCSPECTVNFFA